MHQAAILLNTMRLRVYNRRMNLFQLRIPTLEEYTGVLNERVLNRKPSSGREKWGDEAVIGMGTSNNTGVYRVE